MTELRIVPARPEDFGRYIDLMEETAVWLESRGIKQWQAGAFRRSADFYAASIARGEVHLAFLESELVGALRLLLREPVVWPDIAEDDGVYVFSLVVRRHWAGHRLGPRLLTWAENRAAALGRRYVRLDCMSNNEFLRRYYTQAGFVDRGDVDAQFPDPVGTLRLHRFEKAVLVKSA